MLVVAIPDAFQARRILEHARARNARLDSVVRTHSDAEAQFLHEAGFGTVLMAERELADQMSLYVTDALARGRSRQLTRLRRCGVQLNSRPRVHRMAT